MRTDRQGKNRRDAHRRPLPFLYSRGYSRNAIWFHHVLAAITSACFVLIPAATAVIGPMRSKIQELKGNPAYPFVAERDIAVLPAWIIAYAIAFAALHYAWIRLKQPTSGGWAGVWLIVVPLSPSAGLATLAGQSSTAVGCQTLASRSRSPSSSFSRSDRGNFTRTSNSSRAMIAFGIIEILIVVAIAAYLIKKKSGQADFHAEPMPRPKAFTRWTEALVLALVGGTALFFQITTPNSFGGFSRAEQLDRISSGAATAFITCAVVAVIVFLAAVALGARGRTIAGAIMTLFTFASFGLAINFTAGQAYRQESQKIAQDHAICILHLTDQFGARLEGAEVRIGDSLLGTTPIRLSLADFWERFGDTATVEPEGFKDRDTFNEILDGHGKKAKANPWIRISMPRQKGPESRDFKWEKCFVKATKAGQRLYGSGSSGGGGGTSGFSCSAGVYTPARSAQLRALVTRLRLNSYQLEDSWVHAFLSFGASGFKMLRKLAMDEPGLRDAVDQLTARELESKFGITGDLGEAGARRAFDELLQQIDTTRTYNTDSIEGRAVARLAPQLDEDWLVGQVEQFVRHHGNRSMTWSKTIEGEPSFGTGDRIGEDSGITFPARAFAIAHAIWVVDAILDAKTEGADHAFQNQVVNEILKWKFGTDEGFNVARQLGGSLFEKYATNQDWRREFERHSRDWHRHATYIGGSGGVRANRSFVHLMLLDNRIGTSARTEARDRLFSVIGEASEHGMEPDLMDALFLNNELGPKSPAMEYWPLFKARFTDNSDWDVINKWFGYLVRMEPYPAPEMYTQTLREVYQLRQSNGNDAIEHRMGSAVRALAPLPLEKRALVLKALRRELLALATLADDGKEGSNHIEAQLGDNFPAMIDAELVRINDPETVEGQLSAPYTGKTASHLNSVCNSINAIVPQMFKHSDPRARKDALQAVRSFPTPDYRTRFHEMKNREEDATVRAEIEDIEAQWKRASQQPIEELVAKH
jgi:hypothetical protein